MATARSIEMVENPLSLEPFCHSLVPESVVGEMHPVILAFSATASGRLSEKFCTLKKSVCFSLFSLGSVYIHSYCFLSPLDSSQIWC